MPENSIFEVFHENILLQEKDLAPNKTENSRDMAVSSFTTCTHRYIVIMIDGMILTLLVFLNCCNWRIVGFFARLLMYSELTFQRKSKLIRGQAGAWSLYSGSTLIRFAFNKAGCAYVIRLLSPCKDYFAHSTLKQNHQQNQTRWRTSWLTFIL